MIIFDAVQRPWLVVATIAALFVFAPQLTDADEHNHLVYTDTRYYYYSWGHNDLNDAVSIECVTVVACSNPNEPNVYRIRVMGLYCRPAHVVHYYYTLYRISRDTSLLSKFYCCISYSITARCLVIWASTGNIVIR